VFAVAEGEAGARRCPSGLLRDLAEASGGHMYKVLKSNGVGSVFAAISEDLQNGCLLAFQGPFGHQTARLARTANSCQEHP
jgi:hypothetical protein